MDEFQKELNTLLQKYPDLPEFTLTVRPRVTIEVKKVQELIPVTLPKLSTVPVNTEEKVMDEAALAARIKALGLKTEVIQP